jgi:hypothetical protein
VHGVGSNATRVPQKPRPAKLPVDKGEKLAATRRGYFVIACELALDLVSSILCHVDGRAAGSTQP